MLLPTLGRARITSSWTLVSDCSCEATVEKNESRVRREKKLDLNMNSSQIRRWINSSVFTTPLSCARFKDLINPSGALVGSVFCAASSLPHTCQTYWITSLTLRSWEWTLLPSLHWPLASRGWKGSLQSAKLIEGNNELIIKMRYTEWSSINHAENSIHEIKQ